MKYIETSQMFLKFATSCYKRWMAEGCINVLGKVIVSEKYGGHKELQMFATRYVEAKPVTRDYSFILYPCELQQNSPYTITETRSMHTTPIALVGSIVSCGHFQKMNATICLKHWTHNQ